MLHGPLSTLLLATHRQDRTRTSLLELCRPVHVPDPDASLVGDLLVQIGLVCGARVSFSREVSHLEE
jgi:hypothetical protein